MTFTFRVGIILGFDRPDSGSFPFRNRSYLLRDRDRIYGKAFCEQVAVMNIKEVLNAQAKSRT